MILAAAGPMTLSILATVAAVATIPLDPPNVDGIAAAVDVCSVDADDVFDDGASVVFNGVGTDFSRGHDWARCVLSSLGLPDWLWEVIDFGPFLTEIEQFDFGDFGVVVAPDGEEAVVVAIFETED